MPMKAENKELHKSTNNTSACSFHLLSFTNLYSSEARLLVKAGIYATKLNRCQQIRGF